ncbi:MAG: alpha/beta hydrolase [Roseburia sp.]|nr:alpha/beta hydrolase [Roseburia sp.]
MSETSDRIRRGFKESDDKRDAGLKTPEDISRCDDIVYGDDPVWQVLDVYRPKVLEGEKLPVIVSVHGGGWVYGDKERYQYYCMDLAKRGFAVVNFTYRLAPEFQYPAPLEDTDLVFTWILSHADKYGFDTEHIFAVGDSAGGNGLGLYAAICTNAGYAKHYPFIVPDGLSLKAIALNCGVYQIRVDREEDEQHRNLMWDYLPGHGSWEELELLDVTAHVTKDYPPVFLMTAVDDFLKPQATLLAEKLMACDVPFVCRLYGDADNRLGHVFHADIRTKDAALCNDEECAFFRRFVK